MYITYHVRPDYNYATQLDGSFYPTEMLPKDLPEGIHLIKVSVSIEVLESTKPAQALVPPFLSSAR